jgi:hypothetical protein
MDGTINHGNWFYAVGAASAWGGGFPGAFAAESVVELQYLNIYIFLKENIAHSHTNLIGFIGEIACIGFLIYCSSVTLRWHLQFHADLERRTCMSTKGHIES